MLWEVDIYPADNQVDAAAKRIVDAASELGLCSDLTVKTATGYLVEGETLDLTTVTKLARELFADVVVETPVVARVGDALLAAPPMASGEWTSVTVMPKPGVMDPVAQSALEAIADFKIEVSAVRTIRRYWFQGVSAELLETLSKKLLANDAIEEAFIGPLSLNKIEFGGEYKFLLQTVCLAGMDAEALQKLSITGQLYLQLAEMQTIQKYFSDLKRDPTDIELETIAQTWSEHCSHKTLAGRIAYDDGQTVRQFENMLKETIFQATVSIRENLGKDDWCVSVFVDNAGIVTFDDTYNIAFKVETHNHPSALEPYGGANTGIGGVIRDTLGTGMGAKPICNTDVFCFANPETEAATLPTGVLHPRRVMKGVVEGVRDYGNRMGIPTVNGAVCFDDRYLGNPLVYCGNVGLIPKGESFKKTMPNDLIVSIGGRTGRDGIHGATFSSAELTSESEHLSGGAVQIGNAIEEKKVQDVMLVARDRKLFNAVTDCGAGGFSSAVGEMGEEVGAEVWLDKCPLKYEGLSYVEIWISEAQERMVFSVPEEKWDAFRELCQSENVEAVAIGRFVPTKRLVLKYAEKVVADLPMAFLHDGRPPVIRSATYTPASVTELALPNQSDYTTDLKNILATLNVASKEWIIRQYDHEVQGGSVIKPLVGVNSDGPSDAAVVRPVLGSPKGIVVSNGINPHYGDLDTYHMATSAIDEAMRNCVAVGADPSKVAILDNFCWGDCEKSETLGALVRAALACHDLAIAYSTPFISGKDSLNNEFSYFDTKGEKQTIAIPSTLLISAMGQIEDVTRAVTMDLKSAENLLFIVGETKNELGGSAFSLTHGLTGGQVPVVDPEPALDSYFGIHAAINSGLIRACHDLSEGGLAVAVAEMAFAGGLGAVIDLSDLPVSKTAACPVIQLFSESNSRLLCEVAPEKVAEFSECLGDSVHACIGTVTADTKLICKDSSSGSVLIEAEIAELKEVWQKPLAW